MVDGPSAHSDPTLAPGLRTLGCSRIVDTQAWRFAFPVTWEMNKWTSLPYTPPSPYDGTDLWIRKYVRSDLQFQAAHGADTYLLPGWIPERDGSPKQMLEMVFAAAERVVGTEVDAKPMIATFPCWRLALDAAHDAVESLHAGLSGAYVLINKWQPIANPVDSLAAVAELLLHLERRDFRVIAARGGAITPVLRALGVSAADAGLADAEAFDTTALVRRPQPRKKGKSSPPPGPRIYSPAIGLSLSGKQWREVTRVPAVAAALSCNLRCCRHGGATAQAQDHAVEHSLSSRVFEAQAVEALTAEMRVDRAHDLVHARIGRLKQVNQALREAELAPLRHDHLDNQLNLLHRFAQRAEAG
jgi:hypothetical protein